MNRTRWLPLFAWVLLAAQGCASSGVTPGQRSSSGDAPPRGSCRPAANPAQLPAAGELVDMGAFGAAATRLWADAGRPQGHVLFSIRHSPDGTQVRRAVIESSVPQALADTLQQLMFAHRRQAPAAEREWGVRLRVALAEPPALSVSRREVCVPRPRDREYRTADNRFDIRDNSAAEAATPLLTDPNVVWVHVRLDERGTVTEARVERGRIQRASEQVLLNYVRSLAFHPATEDGYPVPGELTLPVRPSMVR
ncbi:MAG TPA: hypothetical protein VEX86_16185 [Longimicrobium sp.]|nr:hypothetical protein [Longimicrobium sp.]